ncbi:Farnesyl diphosphate synthase [Nesidiocoris tenuis]|uniref:Farnesyl diphosphate synthase n=1 Tax=Nesidiocoris tenuis TaxID=355587 RepID=A0ABN7AMF6_9HEMI|nr:Farnesyl diphosphate synthase [Nesidiocoris tenuis]
MFQPTKFAGPVLRVLSSRASHTTPYYKPEYTGRVPKGKLFAAFNKGNSIRYNHPLDEQDKYLQWLKDDLFLECVERVPEAFGYRQRAIEMLHYNVPSFFPSWSFVPELFYRIVAPAEHQTPENLRKGQILRACVDLKFAFVAVLDDIADESGVRLGKPSWKDACPDGMASALYDAMNLYNFPSYLVYKNFKGTEAYPLIYETLHKGDFYGTMGSHLEMLSQNKKCKMSKEMAYTINSNKAASYYSMQPVLGLAHAGVLDEKVIKQVRKIFYEFGLMFQTWDDFTDYYCTEEQTGKPASDFVNTGITWASTTTLDYLTPERRKEFDECYGSADAEKGRRVRELMDSVNLPGLYIEYQKNQTRLIHKFIEEVDHPKVAEACLSWLEYFTGDVLDD